MKRYGHALVVFLAVGITLTAAILHGRWTNRWGVPNEMPVAADVVKTLPHDFGPWHLKETKELEPAVRGILQCENYSQGYYVNHETGEQVMLTLLLGPPGPMSVHTPEICYSSADYTPLADRQRVNIQPGIAEDAAWMVQFHSGHELQGGITRVYYAWNDGSHWSALDEPRITFGGRPFLFKVQILTQLPEAGATVVEDSARTMLRDFIPIFAQRTASIQASDNH